MTKNSTMTRTYVVTGAASGIGLATTELLRSRGHRVIGVDLRGADLDTDLAVPQQRAALARNVEAAIRAAGGDGTLDAVLAVAGVALPSSSTVRVNHFGAVATVEALRPLLLRSTAPRAAVVTSFSALQDNDTELVRLLAAGDEDAAVARAEALVEKDLGHLIYASTKRSIAQWVRATSITTAWAGAGIPLNAVGPGIVLTPMTAPLVQTDEGRAQLQAIVPMPLHGPFEPLVIARALAWLTGEENSHTTGQVLFVDGGADVSLRGPHIFGPQD
ncbi:SDR family oxidoreductase [Kineococcus sp. R86509]|uniref:SDR family oxidoreductase n=1 Tax=Kineococcus sp. R86509 TaxID=3093851 RepID=UPI0036D3B0D8